MQLPLDPNSIGWLLVGAGVAVNGLVKLRGLFNGQVKNGEGKVIVALETIAKNTELLPGFIAETRQYMAEGRQAMKEVAIVKDRLAKEV